MGFLELFLIAVGLSMDAFAVSICKGLGTKRLSLRRALLVGLYFGSFQALMPLLGWLLGSRFEELIRSVDHWVAFFLLLVIGGNMVKESASPFFRWIFFPPHCSSAALPFCCRRRAVILAGPSVPNTSPGPN